MPPDVGSRTTSLMVGRVRETNRLKPWIGLGLFTQAPFVRLKIQKSNTKIQKVEG
jgi:hypothetical protein